MLLRTNKNTAAAPRMPRICAVLSSITAVFLSIEGIRGEVKSKDVEQHLEMGKQLLSQGQLADALSHFHSAIEGDPNNYLTYYRRATVYLAMGKSKSALPDLNKVVQLKPDFIAARLQRGNVLLKQGEIDEAYIDFEKVAATQPDNQEAIKLLQTIDPLKRDIETAYYYIDADDCPHAIELLSRAIEVCPWDAELREKRAECFIKTGDYFKAINDIKPTTKLRNDNTGAFLQISHLYYKMGEEQDALEQIRECLKLDPDHKECFAHYKKVKKLVKQHEMIEQFIKEERYDECVEKSKSALKTEPDLIEYVSRNKQKICHCYSKAKKSTEAIESCTDVLKLFPEHVDALMDRAEAYLIDQRYDDAINDFQEAKKYEESQRVQEGLKRAQKMLKQSKKKDYYKILGVRRNAKKADILKAYRRHAVKWHPDKYEGDDKKKAEAMFIDIAAAKEVLTDPEKRAKFDKGEDPLDPETQQGQQFYGNPFGQGFNPFGQGGFQFKFHFN